MIINIDTNLQSLYFVSVYEHYNDVKKQSTQN